MKKGHIHYFQATGKTHIRNSARVDANHGGGPVCGNQWETFRCRDCGAEVDFCNDPISLWAQYNADRREKKKNG